MRDVVEVEARDGLHEQVLERRRRLVDGLAELRVVRLERPRDEGAEARHLVLQLAQAPHVLDALGERLDVAVHHRGRRRHALAVRLTHDLEPLVALRLLRGENRPDAIDEDLAATAGDRVEAGVAQAGDRVGDRQARTARDVRHLGRRERVHVELRVALLDRAEQLFVPVDAELGVVPALHEGAGAADCQRLLDLREDHLVRQDIALAHVARLAVERAEVAVRHADVGVVDVPVDDVGDLAGIRLAVADLVGGGADRDEVARLHQRQRVGVGETLAVERAAEDLADGPGGVDDGHYACAPWWRAPAKTSAGAVSMMPASAASSKYRCNPSRLRSVKRYWRCSK